MPRSRRSPERVCNDIQAWAPPGRARRRRSRSAVAWQLILRASGGDRTKPTGNELPISASAERRGDARRHAFAARMSSNKKTEAVRWRRDDRGTAAQKTKNCADNLEISDRELLAQA